MPSALERRRAATRTVTAGAQRIDTTRRLFSRQFYKPNAAPWQERSWTFYDANGDLHRGYQIKANTIAKVRLYAAWQPTPDDEPVPLDEALDDPDIDTTGLTAGLAQLADSTVARVQAHDGGQPEIERLLALNLDVPGEAWLLGRDLPDLGETWSVHSVEQIRWQGGGYVLYDLPTARGTGQPIGPDDILIRLWRKHPRFPQAADSAFRALLDDLEQANLLRASTTSAATSRMAMNGLLLVDSNIDLPDAADARGDVNTATGVYEMLLEAGQTAMRDPSSAAAHMPVVVQLDAGPDRSLEDAIHHQTFDKRLHDANVNQEKDLRQRIIDGADFPPEWVKGLGNTSTYANARVVTSEGYQQDVRPTVDLICAGLAAAWLRPVIAESGVAPETARRFTVAADPDSIIARPDRAKGAVEAMRWETSAGRRLLSDEAKRAALGFDEGDAPTQDELDTPPAPAELPGSEDDDDAGPNQGELAAAASLVPPPVALTAASASTQRLSRLSSRLADIDARLTARLHIAAHQAVEAGVQAAGRKVRARAQGSPAMVKRLQGVPHSRVVAALSEDQRVTLAVGEDDLTGSLDLFQSQWDAWVPAAQTQALRAARTVGDWSPDLVAQAEADQQEDAAEGWGWLAAALLALMAGRLVTPDVAQPEQGEWDPTVTVPFAYVRGSTAIAGGAALDAQAVAEGRVLTAALKPAGGVADGDLILDLLGVTAGVRTEEMVWVHGAPQTPFEPHLRLDGTVFDSWDDDVLLSDGGWPYVSRYFVGDHLTCTCTTERVFAVN